MSRSFLLGVGLLVCLFLLSGCAQSNPGGTASSTPRGIEGEQQIIPAVPSDTPAPAAPTEMPAPSETAADPSPTPVPAATETPAANAPIGETPSLLSIHMLDETNGWGMGEAAVYRTQDGGSGWAEVTPTGLPEGVFLRGFFLDASTAWVIAPDPQDFLVAILYRTVDGGAAWQSSPVPFGSAQIQFLDAQNGWALFVSGAAAGSSTADIYRSQDGGQTWEKVYGIDPQAGDQPGGLPFSGSKNGLAFLDLSRGWVAGTVPMDGYSWLFLTQDGGQTWQHQELALPAGYEAALLSIDPPRFFSAQEGILPVRLFAAQEALVFYTSRDGGLSWNSSTPVEINGVYDFISFDEGWVWDGATLQATQDAGHTWTAITPNVDLSGMLTQLDFVSPQVSWALAMDETGATRLYKTADGGATWEGQ